MAFSFAPPGDTSTDGKTIDIDTDSGSGLIVDPSAYSAVAVYDGSLNFLGVADNVIVHPSVNTRLRIDVSSYLFVAGDGPIYVGYGGFGSELIKNGIAEELNDDGGTSISNNIGTIPGYRGYVLGLGTQPIMIWPLGELASPAPSAVHSRFHAIEGTINGTPTFGATGITPSDSGGTAIQFNGSSYISNSSVGDLVENGATASIVCAFYLGSATDDFAFGWANGSDDRFGVAFTGGIVYGLWPGAYGNQFHSLTGAHIAIITYDGGDTGNEMHLYIDGVEVTLFPSGSVDATLPASLGDFFVGRWAGTGNATSGVKAQWPKVFNIALTAGDAAAISAAWAASPGGGGGGGQGFFYRMMQGQGVLAHA